MDNCMDKCNTRCDDALYNSVTRETHNMRNVFRFVPTAVLRGEGIPPVMDGDRTIRAGVSGFSVGDWGSDARRVVERELHRRNKRRKKREVAV